MTQHEQLLAAVYEAFNERRVDDVLAKMCADVDWPNAIDGVRIVGHEAVRAYWLSQFEHVRPQVHVVSMKENSVGEIVVDVHQKVSDLNGQVLLDRMVQHIYSFRDGKIARMEIREAAAQSA